jgi:aminotransferase
MAPFAPTSNVRAAVEDALARGETHYTDRPGLLALRQQASPLLERRFAIVANARADIVITCGVTEARFVAIQQLLAPGEFFAAPVARERLFGAALLRGAVLRPEIATDTRLVYLTSSTPEAVLRATLAKAPESATILFEVDEAVSTFHPAQLPAFASRTATIGSLGSESWRLGYLLSPAASSPAIREFKQALTICSTNLSQWAALAALEAGEESF